MLMEKVLRSELRTSERGLSTKRSFSFGKTSELQSAEIEDDLDQVCDWPKSLEFVNDRRHLEVWIELLEVLGIRLHPLPLKSSSQYGLVVLKV